MTAQELINQEIPPLQLTDSAQTAIKWMDEYKVDYLPVTDGGSFCGQLSETSIYDSNIVNCKISDFKLEHSDFTVDADQHIYELLKLSIDRQVMNVPVLDDNGKYLGIVTMSSTTHTIARMMGSHLPGGVLVLNMLEKDYSLHEISRLIEADNAKILSTFLTYDERDPLYVNVTLKMNRDDLGRAVATFERFGYNVTAQFHQSELVGNELERLDNLMRFINI